LRRGVAALAVAAFGVVALAGCDAQPGVAAKVDGTVITEAAVADTTRRVNEARTVLGLETATADVVTLYMVMNAYWHALLEDTGDTDLIEAAKTPTAEAFKDELVGLGAPQESVDALDGLGLTGTDRDLLLLLLGLGVQAPVAEALQSELITEEQINPPADLAVNPRYATFDAASQSFLPPSYPWAVVTPGEEEDLALEPEQ
jgi:hypothetical protein